MVEISKRRIFIALLPLIVFNLILVADLLFFQDNALSEYHNQYEWDKNERIYTSKETQEYRTEDGKLMYRYEGEDGNCWDLPADQRAKCKAEHPYGGQGTMTVGGNLVVDNAQAIYINGHDSAGYNWMMTTTTEPYGNAFGTTGGTTNTRANVMYGNNLVVDESLETGSINFAAGASSVGFSEQTCYMVADGRFQYAKQMTLNREENDKSTEALKVLDQGICGVCRGTCSGGQAGRGYQFVTGNGLEVKEMTKVNAQMRICGNTASCEDACCRLLKYLDDNKQNDFLGSECNVGSCSTELPDQTNFFVKGDYTNGISSENVSFCYPQEYPHNSDWVHPDMMEDEYKDVHMPRGKDENGGQDHVFHQ